MKYRIEIEERKNGEKRYIPQVGIPILKIGKFDIFPTKWGNIIKDNTSFFHTSFILYSYNTEQEALDIIEGYKKYLIDEKGKETKSTTYKIVE